MREKKNWLVHNLTTIVMCVVGFLTLAPIVLMIIYSVTDGGEIAAYFSELGKGVDAPFVMLKIIPNKISLQQYFEILIEEQKFIAYFANSSWYAIATILGQVIVAPLAAFAFSKFKFKFRDTLFFLYIVVMMMPFQVVMIPNYIAIRNLGLYNTGWSLILPSIFNPFAVFLMRQYMLSVPDEKLEAAKVDGASNWWIYWKVMLPMVAPGVCAMVVLCFAEVWNMVEQPLLFLSDTTKYPLSLAFREIDIIPVWHIFSGAILFIAPVVILFLIFQDNIVSGIKHIKINN